jgi:hypothetical protein
MDERPIAIALLLVLAVFILLELFVRSKEADKQAPTRIIWRRIPTIILAALWAVLFVPVSAYVYFSIALGNWTGWNPFIAAFGLFPVSLLVGSIAGLKWPSSSWLVLLPVGIAAVLSLAFYCNNEYWTVYWASSPPGSVEISMLPPICR